MNLKVRNRLIVTLILFVSITAGISLILYFLSDNIVFFITPSEISDKHLNKKIRIGGLVEKGSVSRVTSSSALSRRSINGKIEHRIKHENDDWEGVIFTITDDEKSIKIKYRGILPGLFREGQEVVAEGFLRNKSSIFEAERLLTKHDENYKPPEKRKK